MSTAISLEKLTELSDAKIPNNKPVGYTKDGILISEPEIGKPFIVGWTLQTSPVTEIIDKDTFKTLNSIYKIHRLLV